MATYNYSLSSDFGNNINQNQFHQEVLGATGISPTFYGITTTGDNIDVLFESNLDTNEQLILDNLVTSHTPTYAKPFNNFFMVVPSNAKISNSVFTKIASFKFDGSDNIGTIDYIQILSYKNTAITSYDIRAIDRSNSNVLASANFSNNTLEINDLGTISNVPTDKTIIEIQCRQNGGSGNKYIVVEGINIYHNN